MRRVFWRYGLLALVLAGAMSACQNRLRTYAYVLPPPPPVSSDKPSMWSGPVGRACQNWSGYVPDTARLDHLPIKYIRVNVHIMNSRDSSHNFQPDSARRFYKELLLRANAQLAQNERNWRSPDGTPVLPKRYQYQLTPQPGDDGFYFHYDDTLCYFVSSGKHQNNYDRKVIDKYSVGKDSIFNIFVLVHPDDSIRSKTYRANGQGIALGTAFKMAGIYESKGKPEGFTGLFNHEVGHLLGISHAWMEDGCPDTQNHPNRCWTWTKEGPCRDLATNNMMDYNGYQIALTPCQIGKIHATFANEKSQIRPCLVPTWCSYHPERTVTVPDSLVWTGARDLEGDLVIAPGGSMRLQCRVSVPPGGKIVVQPGGHLWLDGARIHNACGKTWEGIFIEEKNGVRGEVHILRQPNLENVRKQEKSNKR